MSSGWGCPHDFQGRCQRVKGVPCDPGMKGCVLFGRFVFSDPAKNRPQGPRRSGQGEGLATRVRSKSAGKT